MAVAGEVTRSRAQPLFDMISLKDRSIVDSEICNQIISDLRASAPGEQNSVSITVPACHIQAARHASIR